MSIISGEVCWQTGRGLKDMPPDENRTLRVSAVVYHVQLSPLLFTPLSVADVFLPESNTSLEPLAPIIRHMLMAQLTRVGRRHDVL